eukprot:5016399-Pleurochrysis_carterae.AAC.4
MGLRAILRSSTGSSRLFRSSTGSSRLCNCEQSLLMYIRTDQKSMIDKEDTKIVRPASSYERHSQEGIHYEKGAHEDAETR